MPRKQLSAYKENINIEIGLFLFSITLNLGFLCFVFKKLAYNTEGFFVKIVFKLMALVEIFCYHMAIVIDE